MKKSFTRTIHFGMIFIMVAMWISGLSEANASNVKPFSSGEDITGQVGPPWFDEDGNIVGL